jgi:O-acetyl-ADP-ribose deacetylase (regulator of RNase III)
VINLVQNGNLWHDWADETLPPQHIAAVNPVNCVGVMGAGIAIDFRTRYQTMYEAYRIACQHGVVKIGELWVWKTKQGKTIINLPTKRDWRDLAAYNDVGAGLAALKKYLFDHPELQRVLLPAVGCGKGGLSWKSIEPLCRVLLDRIDAEIILYAPLKDK